MKLPKQTDVYPGHTETSTIGEEWEKNPFICAWRGKQETTERRCTAYGEPATLLLSAEDYDGGRKCWVRLDEGDMLDIVPGSQIEVTGK